MASQNVEDMGRGGEEVALELVSTRSSCDSFKNTLCPVVSFDCASPPLDAPRLLQRAFSQSTNDMVLMIARKATMPLQVFECLGSGSFGHVYKGLSYSFDYQDAVH